MAFGEILRNARIQKGLTPSDVAEGTRMLVQIVEGLEQEDFKRIAAPIYGRGFIKLYAELMELDPDPLVADFMSLYNGGRSSAVQTKKVSEPAAEPVAVPVTRTVSGPAPRAPQPTMPPVALKTMMDAEAESGESDAGSQEPETLDAPPVASPLDDGAAAVPEPEVPRNEVADLDLFRAPSPSPQRKGELERIPAQEEQGDTFKRKLPIFQVGGRMEKNEDAADAHDEEASARRHARVQVFMDGIAKLKDGVGQRLSDFPILKQKQVWLLGAAGLAVVTAMLIGISVLFKMTDSSGKKNTVAKRERVMPPPPLYMD